MSICLLLNVNRHVQTHNKLKNVNWQNYNTNAISSKNTFTTRNVMAPLKVQAAGIY